MYFLCCFYRNQAMTAYIDYVCIIMYGLYTEIIPIFWKK